MCEGVRFLHFAVLGCMYNILQHGILHKNYYVLLFAPAPSLRVRLLDLDLEAAVTRGRFLLTALLLPVLTLLLLLLLLLLLCCCSEARCCWLGV